MNTVLSAIKKYPDVFIHTLQCRASTTPSESNRINHQALQHAIEVQEWQHVGEILLDPSYRNALEGVLLCLKMDYDMGTKQEILDLFHKEELA